jgi:Sec-independent protein translocase protein TatA
MMFGLGWQELLIVAFVALLLWRGVTKLDSNDPKR